MQWFFFKLENVSPVPHSAAKACAGPTTVSLYGTHHSPATMPFQSHLQQHHQKVL
jgi:hypothetical protein